MSPEVRKTIVYYYVLRSIAAFGFGSVLATYVSFLTKKGLSLFEAHLMNLIFFTTLLVFEVPTGAFADRYGRKTAFVLSCFLVSASKFMYALAPSFWWFVLAELVSGIGVTFSSGAIQAWFFDRLKTLGHHGSVTRLFAREQIIKSGLIVVSALIGSKLAERNIAYPWLFTAICMLFAGLLAVNILADDTPAEESGARISLRDRFVSVGQKIKESYVLARTNEAVMLVVVMGVAQHFALQAPSMQWQPFFSAHFPRESMLGMIFAATMFLQLIGAALAPRVSEMFPDHRRTLAGVQVMLGLGIGLTTLWKSVVPAIIAFGVFQIARGMYVPLKDAYLNHNIPSSERATLISFESLSHHAGGMIGLLVAGMLAQYVSLSGAWVFSGLFLAGTALP